jgi:hypothetical protein
MNSLSHIGRLFRGKDHDLSSLKLRIASALNVFVSIRGLEALLHNETAVVMRKGYETFVIQDASAIANRDNVLAVVHVKDLACYNRLATIQTNHSLHRSTLARIISNDLSDETARQLLSEAGKITAGAHGRIGKF